MPRRKQIQKREILPDPEYGSVMLSKFINAVMISGKKSIAESIVYGALGLIKEKLPNEDPVSVFNTAIDNVKPLLQVKSRRVGGATYQVPVEIAPATRTAIAFRWLIEFSRKRGEKTMRERLAGELMDAYSKQGTTIKRKDDTHRMAEANKAFAHFRF
ncbi:MAG: 30S ribosomal protein S7 [Candidatus Hydrogenedentes bacterium]|nr:30S ribosomal protein S7 [Candidatus Hydrogenedentota bacterium]